LFENSAQPIQNDAHNFVGVVVVERSMAAIGQHFQRDALGWRRNVIEKRLLRFRKLLHRNTGKKQNK
jgi:hypothetical protein